MAAKTDETTDYSGLNEKITPRTDDVTEIGRRAMHAAQARWINQEITTGVPIEDIENRLAEGFYHMLRHNVPGTAMIEGIHYGVNSPVDRERNGMVKVAQT